MIGSSAYIRTLKNEQCLAPKDCGRKKKQDVMERIDHVKIFWKANLDILNALYQLDNSAIEYIIYNAKSCTTSSIF
jgi:hypothetical protein